MPHHSLPYFTLYAQPYGISAHGFSFFYTPEEYSQWASALLNAHGDPVEEFEIQCIGSDLLDADLFDALSIHQGDIATFFESCHPDKKPAIYCWLFYFDSMQKRIF